jgi:hypothetical protein
MGLRMDKKDNWLSTLQFVSQCIENKLYPSKITPLRASFILKSSRLYLYRQFRSGFGICFAFHESMSIASSIAALLALGFYMF